MDAIELKKRMEAAARSGRPEELIAIVEGVQQRQFESDVRTARIGLGIGGLLGFVFGSALAFNGVVATSGPAWVYVSVSLVLFSLGAGLVAMAVAMAPPPRELEHTGVPAKATIEDYRSAFGSMRVGEQDSQRSLSRVAIDLAVVPSTGAPYRVTIKQHLPTSHLAGLQVGKTVDAYVDRARADRIYLVLSRR